MKTEMTFIKIKEHLDDYLEGVSHTLFLRNKFFGGALLALLFFFSPKVALCGFLASFIGYLNSAQTRTPKILRQTGLLTINGLFFGVAFATLFQLSTQFYFCLLIGSLMLPLLTKASFEVLQHWKLSPLIAPYILTIWIFRLCAEGIALRPVHYLWDSNPSLLLDILPSSSLALKLTESLFFSIGQIFLIQNSLFGLLLLLLVTCFKPRLGFFFLLGTALSTVVFYGISGGQFSWHYSFFSCSAGLVSLGLAAMLEKYGMRTIMLYSVISLFLTVATDQLLVRFTLPILSLPYVLTFLLAELSRTPRLNLNWASPKVATE